MSDYQEEIIERLLNLIDFMEDKVAELEERENQLRKSFSDKCDELTLTPQFINGIGIVIDQSTPPDPNTIQCSQPPYPMTPQYEDESQWEADWKKAQQEGRIGINPKEVDG